MVLSVLDCRAHPPARPSILPRVPSTPLDAPRLRGSIDLPLVSCDANKPSSSVHTIGKAMSGTNTMWRIRFANRTGAVGAPASEAAEETAVEVEWDEAVGWLWPRHDIHRLKAPARNSADGLAWWRVIGPETRCPLRWRPELKLVSVYVCGFLSARRPSAARCIQRSRVVSPPPSR